MDISELKVNKSEQNKNRNQAEVSTYLVLTCINFRCVEIWSVYLSYVRKKNLTYVILKPNLNTTLKQNLNYLKPKLNTMLT